MVLADSSAWVCHLTGERPAVGEAMVHCLRSHRVAINDVVRVEVLTGARDEAQYHELADLFQGLHPLALVPEVWQRAGRVRFELRRRGHLIPLPDVLVACCALVYDCELLHADRHFAVIARYHPLQCHQFAHT